MPQNFTDWAFKWFIRGWTRCGPRPAFPPPKASVSWPQFRIYTKQFGLQLTIISVWITQFLNWSWCAYFGCSKTKSANVHIEMPVNSWVEKVENTSSYNEKQLRYVLFSSPVAVLHLCNTGLWQFGIILLEFHQRSKVKGHSDDTEQKNSYGDCGRNSWQMSTTLTKQTVVYFS